MQNAFESWIGQEVVLHLGFGQTKVRLRGVLLRDHTEYVLTRPAGGTNTEVAKTKVLAIEGVERRSLSNRPNWMIFRDGSTKALI
ncbi:MAG TPA: hypothetical protein VJN92_02770 [Candidatus Acidoferrum sp.]|nr:hypothetical protein [Candidatus Acidoferrum sp.]